MFYINGKFLTQPTTGVQRFAREILNELIKQPISFIVLCPPNTSPKEMVLPERFKTIGKNQGVKWEQIDLPSYLNTKEKPVLLNLCNSAPLLYKNQVVTLHDLAFFVNPGWFSKPFSLWYRFIIPILARRSRKILTVSMFSKGEIINILKQPAEKIIVVYNSSSQLNSGHSEPVMYGEYLLFVGSLDPRKNLITLVNAFKSANQANLKLVIAGMVNKNFGLVDLDYSENIIYLGKVSDAHLAALYKNAVAFVYPSLYEGFGIPPLEAMQHGCPVLVSESSSLPEVCGDAAIYFNPHNTEELAEKIKLISENEKLRTQLKQKGLKRVTEFSWSNSANIIKNVINDLN
ncbi:glycosyltransferase family 1 protein [Pedobacter sp. BMA]|uniref:glycosyltransferase family 4 protein n=1 Tax=Pedobacter sp. BMA TaxID=1663685 RepID=UPI000649CC1C|nr:glycosyltransferase family 1 protein [Pedobacter sp. BMA]KLT64010.1 hypothetical protein AB669_18255 [Pedobacter sp. BMA]